MTMEEEYERRNTAAFDRGVAAGLERGMATGLERGMAAGLERGMVAGREEGMAAAIRKLAISMKANGRPLAQIAQDTGLSVAEIEAL